MAAAAGPDMMAEAPTTDGLDNGLVGRFAAMPTREGMSSQDSGPASPEMSPKSALPLPNPPFVFPARPSSYSAPSSFSRATGRRPRSAIEPKDSGLSIAIDNEKGNPRSPALPSFSFNPGASLSPAPMAEASFLSPPHSPGPESPRSIPIRPSGTGHRRGGSEFVGGSIRSGDTITVLSTSPTKSESGMASPMLLPAKPTRPRGHAHRRSAAISSHDLASIILPSPHQNLRGSSAPASPAILDRAERSEYPLSRSAPAELDPASPTSTTTGGHTPNESSTPVVELHQPPKPPTRNRVGFSDTLEFIPRPLSLVSSDTSSTATARPGHSVSGSISSVISVTNVDRDLGSPVGFGSARRMNEARPSTAGAVLERTQSFQDQQDPALSSPRRRGSIPHLGSLPVPTAAVSPATPSPTKSLKKWSFFSLDPFVAASPTRSRPLSAGSNDSQTQPVASAGTSSEQVPKEDVNEATTAAADLKPITKKRSKKQKKVKTWAGSILSRKSKARHNKQKRKTPTPPPISYHIDGERGEDDEAYLEMSPEPESTMPTLMVTETSSNGRDGTWRPSSLPDEDTSYPMIDLDAALGPFNTPLPRNAEWEASQKAAGHSKKQLHSAAGMSRFTGPGMHYHHRRAESAPEMVPFEAGRLGFPRFGSSSTMADVFEEDEEDDDDSASKTTGQSTPVRDTLADEKLEDGHESISDVAESNASQTATSGTLNPPSPGIEPRGPEASERDWPLGAPKMKFNHSTSSLHDEVIPEEPMSYDLTAPPMEPPYAHDHSNSATPSPRQLPRPKDLAPVDVSPLNLPMASLAPISPYSMTQSSSFPSPRSPMSYDAHRVSTAPSSITEDNFQSLLMGEPGPEVRISVDDIPSLTSSNSTMTRDSIFAQHPQARHPPLMSDQPRPASFTSTAFGRRRSSLASLSRLISSSHGERSKLSMEVTMDSEPEKKAKLSKSKRISRMMQFWKSKEAEST